MNKERNKIIANNIRKYVKESKMTQKQLAELIGITPSTLSDYLNLRSNPSHGVIQKIADVFGVVKSDIDTTYKEVNDITTVYNQLTPPRQHNVLDFANHQLELQNSTSDNVIDLDTYKNENTTLTNVNGYVSAGTGEQIFDEPIFKVNVKGYVPPHDLALQVNGDSMEPLFDDKQVIFIEKTNHIDNGQIGVFIIDGEAYVKRVFVEENRLTLVSLNKDYRDLHFYRNEGVKLVGKVIL
ncbi:MULTISPECIES: XRE family transcriptional regulator [Staphylococcus]|uniref:XRE family transcriptional regulator n=1 Tax=Staphylococcus TaxID=1279 RepID=UPI0008A55D13|nr:MULTISPECIES: XRE family transcriptional regulator [Staphylococcus]MBM7132720.1 helix-turn-helix transcriptional regulator [Staphylococcus lugdunensis]MCH8641126.1 XRE family transcriptional regulator [Staphylococcus lugdunensis]MCH8644454.1 XRE family transcriptional regulator [Staphylococcus lugdunensis]MDK7860045.1 XRE family transcriptional regulator [Staphylococcus lugdunensis]MDK8289581.1 XRE family transcriptional regulator [Staphylococcus lugdunensis]